MAKKAKASQKLHPEILKKNGRNQFVILPYEEFVEIQRQLEDAQNLTALRRAMLHDNGGPGLTLNELKSRLGLGAKGTGQQKRRLRHSG